MNNLFEILESVTILVIAVGGYKQTKRIIALEKQLNKVNKIAEIREKYNEIISNITIKRIKTIHESQIKSKEEFSQLQTEIESNYNIFVKDFNDNFTTVGENEAKLKQALKLIASENKQFNLRLNALSSNIHKIDDKCKVSFLKVGEKLGVTKKEDEKLEKSVLNGSSSTFSEPIIPSEKTILKEAKKKYKNGTYFIPLTLFNSKTLDKCKNYQVQVVLDQKFNFKDGKLFAKTGSVTSHVIWDNNEWAEIIPSTNE